MMKTKLLISALTFSLMTNTAMAKDGSAFGKYEEERVGTGLGVFIGTLAGGPVGAVVAGYIGNKMGESKGEEKELAELRVEHQQTQDQLARMSAEKDYELAQMQHQLDAMKQKYADTQVAYQRQMEAMHNRTTLDNALGVSLQFRTGSTEIESQYHSQLKALASVMKGMPNFNLDLSGHADRQGDEKYNQKLSLNRANAVKAFLIRQGVNPARLNVTAFGESQPLNATETAQTNFFDRRVLLQLSPSAEAVAKNQ